MPRAFLVKRSSHWISNAGVFESEEQRCLESVDVSTYDASKILKLPDIETLTATYSNDSQCTCRPSRKRYDSCTSTSTFSSEDSDTTGSSECSMESQNSSPTMPSSALVLPPVQRPQISESTEHLLNQRQLSAEATPPIPLVFPWNRMMLPRFVPQSNLFLAPGVYTDQTTGVTYILPRGSPLPLQLKIGAQLVAREDDSYKRHQCHVCNKWFKRASSLSNHRLIHKNLKDYKCEECGMGFLRKSDLAKHVVTHSGSKPFQCDVCHKKFSQSSNMLTHKRRHSGVRPYSCSYCGKSFYRKVDVRRHSAIHKDF